MDKQDCVDKQTEWFNLLLGSVRIQYEQIKRKSQGSNGCLSKIVCCSQGQVVQSFLWCRFIILIMLPWLTVAVLLGVSLGQYQRLNCLNVQHAILQLSGAVMSQVAGGHSFTMTWDRTEPLDVRISLALTQYTTDTTAGSFNTFEMSIFDQDQSGVGIRYSPDSNGSRVVMIGFDVFVARVGGCLGQVELLANTFNPTTATFSSCSNNCINQYLPVSTLNFQLDSNVSQFKIYNMFLDYTIRLWCDDEIGITIFHNTVVVNSTHFTIEIKSCNGLQVDRISFTTVIVDVALAPIYLYEYQYPSTTVSQSTSTTLMDTNLAPTDALFFENCSIYLTQTQVQDQASAPIQISRTFSQNNVNFVKVNMKYSKYQFLCLWECADGWKLKTAIPYDCYTCNYTTLVGYFTNDSTDACLVEKCSDYMFGCAQCTSSTVCDVCQNGTSVEGGCTNDSYCLQVAQLNPNTTAHTLQCTICSDPRLDPVGDSCIRTDCTATYCRTCTIDDICTVCYVGYLAGGLCTLTAGCGLVSAATTSCLACASSDMQLTDGQCFCVDLNQSLVNGECISIPGCISAITAVDGSVSCVACNGSTGMSVSNGSCACADGFEITAGTCNQTCGDGKLFSLSCDDGNNVDGDGCSAACVQQQLHHCENGSLVSPSQCIYVGPVTLSLSWMENTGQVNEGVFAFSVDPPVSAISKMNFTQLTQLTVGGQSITVKAWSYESGQLQLLIDYDRTIEGDDSTLSVSLDPAYVITVRQTQSFTFSIDSRNLKMEYVEDSSQVQQQGSVLQMLCWVAVVVALISAFLHTMMAVELITLFQLLFLLHFQTQNYSFSWSVLQKLTYLMVNPVYSSNQKSNLLLGGGVQAMEWGVDNDEASMVLIIGSACGLAFTYLIISLLLTIIQSAPNIGLLGQIQAIISRLLSSVCGCLLIPAVLLQADQSDTESNSALFNGSVIGALLRSLALAIISMVLSQQWAQHCCKSSKQSSPTYQPSSHYCKVYLLFVLVSAFLFAMLLLDPKLYFQKFIMLMVASSLTAWQVCSPPSQSFIHNLGPLMSHILISIVSLLLIIRDVTPSLSTSSSDTNAVYFILASLSLILMVYVLRIIHIIYHKITACKTTTPSQPQGQQVSAGNDLELSEPQIKSALSALISHDSYLLTVKSNMYSMEAKKYAESVNWQYQIFGQNRNPVERQLRQHSKIATMFSRH